MLDELLAGRRRSPAGRPGHFTVEAVLVGLLLTATLHTRMILRHATRALVAEISPAMRDQLGVRAYPATAAGENAAYAAFLRRFWAVVDLLDDSPNPRNRRYQPEEFSRLVTPLSAGEAKQRATLRAEVANRVLRPSFQGMLDVLRDYPGIGTAVDNTFVSTYARPPSKVHTSADPDAGLYVREHEVDDTVDGDTDIPSKASKPKRGKGKLRKDKTVLVDLRWGYEAALIVSGTTHPVDDRLAPPVMVGGFTLTRPGVEPGRAAITALTHATRAGWPAGLLAGDRAYNNEKPENFQLPARALGFEPLFSYRRDQLGIQAEHAGAVQIEGRWYCPHMPSPLVTASIDHSEKLIDPDIYAQRIDARRPYELRPKAHPDREGHQRMLCPAAGPAATVRCPLKKPSMRTAAKPTVIPDLGPVGPPRVCSQQSITIPPEAGAKHAQALAYRTPEWRRAYGTLRNSVEGLNGYAKNPGHGVNLEDSGLRRVRGIAAQTLLLSFQLTALNLRKQQRWHLRQRLNTTAQDNTQRPRRRTTTSLTDYQP